MKRPIYKNNYLNSMDLLSKDISSKEFEIESNIKTVRWILSISWFVLMFLVAPGLGTDGDIGINIFIWLCGLFSGLYIFQEFIDPSKLAAKKYPQLFERRLKLQRLIEEERRHFSSEYDTYCRVEGDRLTKLLKIAIKELDVIKDTHLFRKTISKKNKNQIKKWQEYQELIKSIAFPFDRDLKIDQNLKNNFNDHYDYMRSRLETQNRKDVGVPNIISNRDLIKSKEEIAIENLELFLENLLKTDKSKVDYTEKKTNLGLSGEEFVLKYEKEKLVKLGILTERYPIHVSKIHGDEFGFDILSLDLDLQPLLLEVKTTSNNKNSPFFLTRNELKKMTKFKNNYQIVRVYNFECDIQKGDIEYISKNKLDSSFSLTEEVFKVNASS